MECKNAEELGIVSFIAAAEVCLPDKRWNAAKVKNKGKRQIGLMVKSRALKCIMYMNALSYMREGEISVTGSLRAIRVQRPEESGDVVAR
jgi:hypothetical protein